MEQTEKILLDLPAVTRKASLKTPTILVVDEDPIVCLHIQTRLKSHYKIISIPNATAALTYIREEHPSVVLCNKLATVSDDLSLLQALKQDLETEHIPVILLSDRGDEGELEVYDKDASDYLIKPFSAKELLARVRLQLKIISIRESSNRSLKNLFLNAPVAICILRGPKFIVELANDNMLQLWGRNLDEVLNKPVFSSMPDLGGQGLEELLATVYKTGERFVSPEVPLSILRYGKSEKVFVKFVYEALLDEDGAINGVMAVADEITELVLARKSIEQSQHRYQQMVYSSPSAIAILKGDELIIDIANDAILETWGKGKDVFGKPLLAIMPEVIDQGFDKLFHHVYTTGEPRYGYEVPVQLMRNGKMELSYYTFVYQAQRNMAGEIEGIAIIANEVSPQAELSKKIIESESHLRKMYDLMPAKITNADPDGGVTYCNRNWLDYTGLSFADFSRFGYYNIMHPDELDEFRKRMEKAAKTGTDFEMEMRFMNLEGEYKWHLNRASPVRDEAGNISMWIGVTTEIHEMKEVEIKKEDFLKMVSHELKTPVTSIKGYVQMLLAMLKEEQQAKLAPLPVRSSLLRVQVQVERLTKLVNEILDISRFKENKLELHKQTFNFNNLVDETVQDILHTKPHLTIKIFNEPVCEFYGDKDRIGQVIINFITNAIKYSPVDELIEVRVKQGENKQILFSVKDFGIGIEKKHQEKIFERFYRVEGKNENIFAGFGIGLFIANEIVKRHNGFIKLESKIGKGSVFTFVLPCYEENNKELAY
ncbi:MAG: ATP-binding protein [Daejeonella sp.]|uniref:ATP-binding protein n=1 Tax=Daejeonella sp. TaxID=2805397 RepID=UPI003C71E746